ncbi:MAG: hypothetical protein JW965_07095 [Bacteroidales bacterium]|nr:hypothetical protein [Bacteroidales bacterium]
MKTLHILLVIAFVIISGFAKDTQTDENVFPKKGTDKSVTVPIKVWVTTIDNNALPRTDCTGYPPMSHTGGGWLEGHQTHGGRFITSQSTWIITDCETSGYINTSHISGTNTVANGDSYPYTCDMEVVLAEAPPFMVTLYITIGSGTGRFEGASGYVECHGYHNGEVISVAGEGTITFAK